MNDQVGPETVLVNSRPDHDFLVVNGGIDRALHYRLSATLASRPGRSKCTIFLTTYGGDPNAGFRIARCIRHHYPDYVRIVIGSFCKSAGTLVAIAANELAIGDLGELGPLDIQVRKGSELEERSSGLDILQALQTVSNHTQVTFHQMLVDMRRASGLSTKLVAGFAAEVATGMAAPLFSQIDPIRLGEMQRATMVALEYGKRLDAYASNLQEGALASLIRDYPAHGFVIDRKEAKELFRHVCPLTLEEMAFCERYWQVIADQRDEPVVVFIDPEDGSGVQNDVEDDVAKHEHGSEVNGQSTDAEPEPGVGEGGHEDPGAPDEKSVRIRAVDVGHS